MEDCIFCKIARAEMPCFKVYEDDRVLAFGDISPFSEGHTLIIPKMHAKDLWEISGEDLTAVHLASRKVIQAIKEALNATGVACLQLNGRSVGQIVMHYHLHLIPHTPGGPKLPLTGREFKQGDMEAIRKCAEKIAAAIK
ncbi:MAG: HIT family protein [Thermodesulfobacteriota bacterium]|nr:HIT family protein [Thermodesulfobacteriota bacterium]